MFFHEENCELRRAYVLCSCLRTYFNKNNGCMFTIYTRFFTYIGVLARYGEFVATSLLSEFVS